MTIDTGANGALDTVVLSQSQGPGLDCRITVRGGEENGDGLNGNSAGASDPKQAAPDGREAFRLAPRKTMGDSGTSLLDAGSYACSLEVGQPHLASSVGGEPPGGAGGAGEAAGSACTGDAIPAILPPSADASSGPPVRGEEGPARADDVEVGQEETMRKLAAGYKRDGIIPKGNQLTGMRVQVRALALVQAGVVSLVLVRPGMLCIPG